MLKHTPGPWRIAAFSGSGFHIFSGGEPNTGRQVALVESTYSIEHAYHEGDANSRLVAAAPEMIELLKMFKAGIDCGELPVHESLADWTNRLITKIKGEK